MIICLRWVSHPRLSDGRRGEGFLAPIPVQDGRSSIHGALLCRALSDHLAALRVAKSSRLSGAVARHTGFRANQP
jgi:hypothetical protein